LPGLITNDHNVDGLRLHHVHDLLQIDLVLQPSAYHVKFLNELLTFLFYEKKLVTGPPQHYGKEPITVVQASMAAAKVIDILLKPGVLVDIIYERTDCLANFWKTLPGLQRKMGLPHSACGVRNRFVDLWTCSQLGDSHCRSGDCGSGAAVGLPHQPKFAG